MTHDPTIIRAYQEDPLVHPWISTRWFVSFGEAGDRVEAEAAQITVPSVFLVSTGDRLVSHEAGAAVARRMPNCELIVWPDLYHEPHNEPEQDEVLARLRREVLAALER